MACSCLLRHSSRDKKRLLDEGTARVEDALDVVQLVKNQRMLKTLLRLILTKKARDFIRVQRKDSVIGPVISKDQGKTLTDDAIIE